MLRRILNSPWTYFGGAGVLLLAAIASQFEVRLPSRPQGSIPDIAALRERGDLNVVFVLVDTLRRAGCTLQDLEIGKPDLEDVFLDVMKGKAA